MITLSASRPSLALALSRHSCHSPAGATRSRARCWSCSPARAARPARRPTSCSASLRSDPSLVAAEPGGRLLGLSRLEGHAGAHGPRRRQRAYAERARRPRSLHAADGGQRRGACARQRQGGDRARDRAEPQAGAHARRPVQSVARRQADGERCRPRTTARRARVWLCPITKSVPVEIGRGENRGHDHHLHQRGAALDQARRMERQGADAQRAAPGFAEPATSMRLAVVVQSGSRRCAQRCSAPRRSRCGKRIVSDAHSVRDPDRTCKIKRGRREAGPEALGIEPYAETTGPVRRAPGGWGAEESGALSGPGL